ncbi:DJ-1/PfpI family protein [Paenibacillus alginolyticus]|uniref:DJ-1/PfpI family protein n=1 Tax=Paenibacillus alginolyticus TaxID=59839 RepID=A0ABT4GLC9_9BACL|nr:DJ-1/PfpI family protein [Paenibacillus alginolyticus]MCY9697010.1 DJ-1/PfpI family protein [Paenibacillus alginolyticus]MEC0148436.1 DJ-1/PfpI family protein [Paenibacillus alginolyticus]
MRLVLRIVIYVCIFVVFVGGVGAIGYSRTMQSEMSGIDKPSPLLQEVKIPEYDPRKPTVAVILGDSVTEVIDFLVPYEMFSLTGAYNVFAVASDRHIKSLTGGLDLLPHYSFKEMDDLLGKSPDIIVIPNIPIMEDKKVHTVQDWIIKNSGNKPILLSICNGAETLAETGLLNGKSAATHWGDMNRLEKKYPEVHWQRDQRYVPDGNIVSSAGVTSGIDAVLYVISQQLGEAVAVKIAEEMNYPTYQFVHNPKMEPFSIEPKDAAYILNFAYQWNKKQAGVLLYNGIEETALGSIFDSYSASGTTKTMTISSSEQPVVIKYHLNLQARYQMYNAPRLDKMIIAGTQAKTLAAETVNQWKQLGKNTELLFIHSDSPKRFVMEAPLEDLSKQEDVLTAHFAAKRLEYRANHLSLDGKPFSLDAFGIPLLIGALSVGVTFYIDRRFIRKKRMTKSK